MTVRVWTCDCGYRVDADSDQAILDAMRDHHAATGCVLIRPAMIVEAK